MAIETALRTKQKRMPLTVFRPAWRAAHINGKPVGLLKIRNVVPGEPIQHGQRIGWSASVAALIGG
ncbi:hypothetical protein VEGS18_A43330 (plasmid) [Escherichia coli]|nr:hypothetical protein VEGS18_A43330 [Escherichia coli]